MAPRIHPPFAQPDPARRATPTARVEAELPPIEQFLDDLPSIDQFLLPEERAPITPDWSETSLYRVSLPAKQRSVQTAPPDIDNEGWAVSDWQSYDWSEVASLGAPEPEAVEAHAAWSSTDWDTASRHLTDLAARPGRLPAEDIAAALDEMARRIRTGELSLERFHGTPPEAAIAAVFAALLRTRG